MMHPVTDEDRPDDQWSFYPEAIKSWRSWYVIDHDGVLVLRSITHDVVWIPRQELVAKCLKNRLNKHPSTTPGPHATPNIDHGCGIYSVKTKEQCSAWVDYANEYATTVYGEANVWGNVLAFTRGYLSEYAYPARLYVPDKPGKLGLDQDELAHELSNTYLVEAVIE